GGQRGRRCQLRAPMRKSGHGASGALPDAGTLSALTVEQRHAAATGEKNIFIEAGPGSGKTTVSAQRFGVLRFAAQYRYDSRAVVAVSFTRAATSNLRRRVQR